MRFGLVLVLLAACGDGIGAPDATPPPDSNAGLVRVHYSGQVAQGNAVFFQNADSSLVLATRTDSQGDANAYIAPGGFVTLVELRASTRFIYTWSDVHPGDELVFGSPGSGKAAEITLGIPTDPGASFYQLYSSCGGDDVRAAAGSQLVIQLFACDARADMFVLSIGSGFHYLYAEDVPISDGGSVSLPPPYRVMERSTISVQNVPDAASAVTVSQSLVGEGRQLFLPSETSFGAGFIPLSSGGGTTNIDMPLPPEGTVMTQIDPIDSVGIGTQHVIRWDRSHTTTTIDFSVGALRKYTEKPVYQRTTHTLRWAEDTSGVIANAVLATVGWNRPEIGGNYQWQILAPRGEEPVVRLPVLPGDLHPREHDVIIDPSNYPFVNISVEGGFERVRTHAWDLGGLWPADGATGSVVYEDLTPMQFPPD